MYEEGDVGPLCTKISKFVSNRNKDPQDRREDKALVTDHLKSVTNYKKLLRNIYEKIEDTSPEKTVLLSTSKLLTECEETLRSRLAKIEQEPSSFQPAANSTKIEENPFKRKELVRSPPESRRALKGNLEIQPKAINPTCPPLSIQATMANTTLANASTIGRAAAKPKFTEPLTFNPAADHPLVFLADYEHKSRINGWKDEDRINYLEAYVKGEAAFWVQEYIGDIRNAEKTWSDLTQEFTKKFGGENCSRRLKLKLANRRQQATESLKSFYFDLRDIARQADPTLTAAAFRDYLENGMLTKYLDMFYMLCKSNMSFEDIQEAILKINDLTERKEMAELTQQATLLTIDEARQELGHRHDGQSTHRQTHSQRRDWQPRTRDGRVVCFRCGKAGHFAASCLSRNVNDRRNSPQTNRGNLRHRPNRSGNSWARYPNQQGRHQQ